MKLLGDYHTHTIYSRHNHGKGTIEQNAMVALNKGLKQIAITDHGFNHKFYGVRREKIDEMRTEIERLNGLLDIDILLGVETNLISSDGLIDLTREEEGKLDIVLMGYHKCVKVPSFKDRIKFFDNNKLGKYFGYTKNMIQRHTDAYLKAIDKNNIDVLTHLNYGMPVDCVQIAKLAKEKDVYIELNGKRTIFTQDEVNKMVEMKTKFIVNSDAHKPENVGECNLPTNFALTHHIPEELIVNFNELPKFKMHRKG